jgi:hypothetical protein
MVPFRQRGFVLPNAAMPAHPEPVAGPRPNAALLRVVIHCYFSLFFIVIGAGGDIGRSAQSRAAQGEIRRFSPTPALLFHCY